MIIGNYKIESDSLNVTVSIKRVNTGRKNPEQAGTEYYMPVAYFADVKGALKYIVKQEVNATGLADLETVVKKQDELFELITSLERG